MLGEEGTDKIWSSLPCETRVFAPHWEPPPVYMESCEVIGNIFDNPELPNVK